MNLANHLLQINLLCFPVVFFQLCIIEGKMMLEKGPLIVISRLHSRFYLFYGRPKNTQKALADPKFHTESSEGN